MPFGGFDKLCFRLSQKRNNLRNKNLSKTALLPEVGWHASNSVEERA